MNEKNAVAAAEVAAAPEKPPGVQTMERIGCPIPGEKIPPCCGPEIDDEDGHPRSLKSLRSEGTGLHPGA